MSVRRVSKGQPRVRTHLVRRLPGSQFLPEEHADQRDTNCHSVPLPDLAQPECPGDQPDAPGLPQVGNFFEDTFKTNEGTVTHSRDDIPA